MSDNQIFTLQSSSLEVTSDTPSEKDKDPTRVGIFIKSPTGTLHIVSSSPNESINNIFQQAMESFANDKLAPLPQELQGGEFVLILERYSSRTSQTPEYEVLESDKKLKDYDLGARYRIYIKNLPQNPDEDVVL